MSTKQRALTEKEEKELIAMTKKLKTPDPIPGRAGITEHEGNKYLREIVTAAGNSNACFCVDVYCVLQAFDVTCPATQHTIKKLLCAGLRAKGDRLADLIGALAALNRAIDMEQQRTQAK